MKINIIILFLMISSLAGYAQNVIKLAEGDFYKLSSTALGKAIVFTKRNVQLRKVGTFKVTTKDREIQFSLNKNFYVDGVYSSIDKNKNYSNEKYINGSLISSVYGYADTKITKKIEVKKDKNNYLITETEIYQRGLENDSTIKKYINEKPLLKEKYSNGKLMIQNNREKGTIVIYDRYGNLQEKHYDNIEEKYDSDGKIYFKKVYLKDKVEEYQSGKLSKVLEFREDKNQNAEIVIISTYDVNGNKTSVKETIPWAEPAPDYLIFDLEKDELASYKTIAVLK
ncbi:hypothetical protein [Pedobacter punctiformis]|uniref:Uncharacterized protein n=1 Tax=Pedobacter punctiformis TaxID=3004097 RepID=A0ABT4L888_9SPHI|nr:hypothetical protein [Pedobacter sp. HCMS5-2]MCZ4244132.1 hypothetical protein [Pedobacter sp. HCMS5-2]